MRIKALLLACLAGVLWGVSAEAQTRVICVSGCSGITTGTAGSASTSVVTVQGIASMTPLLVNPGTGTLWGVYTEGDTDASITGAALLWEDAGNTLVTASASKPLPVEVVTSTTIAITELPAAAALANNSAVPTTTMVGAVCMVYDGATIDFCTNSDVVEDAAETAGVSGPMVLNVRRDVAASSAGATGENATFNSDALGLQWTRFLDPCSGVAKTYIPIDIVTAATTEITAALAGASNHYYVCALHLVTAAANNVALVDDDSDNCTSVTSGVAGGATAAEGWNLVAGGGLTQGNGNGSVAKTNGTNRVLCLMTSAATQLSGTIVVAAAP